MFATTTTTATTHLSPERLRLLGQTFFATRGERVAMEIEESIELLIATFWVYRHQLSEMLLLLPDPAFEAQETTYAGEERWSAGQIVDHVVRSQRFLSTPAVRAFIEPGGIERYESPSIMGSAAMLSRAEAVALLDEADDELAALHDEIPIGILEAFVPDTIATVEDIFFGTLTLKTMLLLMAMHESSHLRQLREL